MELVVDTLVIHLTITDDTSAVFLIQVEYVVATHMTSQLRHTYNHKRLHTTDSEWIV